jgi:hypothetical protein
MHYGRRFQTIMLTPFVFCAAVVISASDNQNNEKMQVKRLGGILPTFDTITTDVISLAVGADGSFGGGDSIGSKAQMDFFDFVPECDTVDSIPGNTRKYIFNASLIIGGVFNGDTILSNSIYGGGDSLNVIYQLSPQSAVVTDNEIQIWSTGTLTNFDSSIGFRYKFYAPQSTLLYDFDANNQWYTDQQFITKELKVWALDGADHYDLAIGEIIDWDIPSDSGDRNAGEVDSTRNLLYCVGAEFDQDSDVECQDNDLRFGGMAFGYYKRFVADADTVAWFVLDSVPHGGYHEANVRFVDPGWDDNRLYTNMAAAEGLTAWSHEDEDSQFVNLHSVLTYLFDCDLLAGDTLVFYSVMASVRNANDETPKSTSDRIKLLTDKARNFVRYFGCCHDLRGDLNTDGIDGDLLDLTFLVQHIYNLGPAPTCAGEGDVNADGSPSNVLDLSYLVNTIFRGGPDPYGCGEPPCKFSGCHDE